MNRARHLIAASALLGVLLAGCGDDGGGGDNTAGASATGGAGAAGTPQLDAGPEPPAGLHTRDFTAMNIAVGACQHVTGGAAGSTCQGVEEFTACALDACPAADYMACWGANYAQNDTSGSPCDTFIDCVLGSADHCSHACTPEPACQACIGMRLGQCILLSNCPAPTCSADS